MLNQAVAKQILELQKSAFDNTFNALVMWQDSAERMSRTVLDQNAWLPQEGRQMADQWTQMVKSGREDFREMVHTGFDQLAEIYADQTTASSTPKNTNPQTAKTAAK